MGFTENNRELADPRLLAHSLANIGEMVSVTDLEDRFTYVNQAFLRIYGYTQEEVLGRHVSLVRSPNNPPGLDREILDHTRAGGWKGEVLNRTKDGREILIGLSTSQIWDEAGKILGLVGIGRDITDRKRAEAEIRSLAKFPAENPDPVLRVARDGTILFANPASKPLLDSWGCQVGQRLPRGHRDVIPDAIELRSVKEFEVLSGDRIFSIQWSPVPEGQYVNVYGRDITARKRAEEALVRRTQQLEAVRAVSAEITRELDLTRLLDLIHLRSAELLGAKSGALFLLDEATGALVPQAWQGLGEWMGAVRVRLGEGVAGTVAERRAGMVVTDYRTSPYRIPLFLECTGMTSVVAEPLLYRDRVVGVLSMNNDGMDRAFGEEDRETLALFAAQAAIAIENARLHADAVRHGEQLEILLGAFRSVMSGLDLQGSLDRIVAEAVRSSGCSHVKLLLLDRQNGVLRIGALQGTTLPPDFTFPMGTSLSGLVAQTGQPVYRAEVVTDPLNTLREQDQAAGVVTYLGLPIQSRDGVLGVLTFNTTTPRRYSSEELAYLTSFAAQAAIAIENARLHGAAVRRGEELAALLRATRSVMSGLDLRETLDRMLEEASHIAGTPHVKVLLVDREAQALRLAALAGRPAALLEGFQLPLGVGYSGIVAATGKPLYVPDCPNDRRNLYADQDRELGLITYLGLPIMIRGEILGVLTFNTEEPRQYSPEQIAYLTSFADMAAIAIENARLFQQVSRGKAEWEHTFDSIPDLVAVIGADNRLVRVNRATAERLRMPPGALVGRRCSEVLPCDEAICCATGATREAEDPRLGGTFVITSSPLRNPEGHVMGHVCLARDITEMKRLEEESRHRQQFEDLSRAKSAFIANMSHELRTPLNSILGFSQLLVDLTKGVLPDKQVRYLAHIHNSGQHLLQLISDILDLSKVEAGKFVLQPEPLNVATTLDDILVIARGLANKKSQTIQAVIAPDLPPLQADPVRFKQILFNLLSNAVKFTPESGTITVRAFQEAAGSGQRAAGSKQETAAAGSLPTAECLLRSLVIEVTDTGVGINAEDLPRLFQEFVQLERTRAQNQEGTGLGLALTKQLVELHGGRIWAESEGEGKGSTFGVRLPCTGPAGPGE